MLKIDLGAKKTRCISSGCKNTAERSKIRTSEINQTHLYSFYDGETSDSILQITYTRLLFWYQLALYDPKFSSLVIFQVERISHNFVLKNHTILKNITSRNEFLAACRYIEQTTEVHKIKYDALFSGKIGTRNSKLDKHFNHYKNFRSLAVFHDNYGYWKRVYIVGWTGLCIRFNVWQNIQKFYAFGSRLR